MPRYVWWRAQRPRSLFLLLSVDPVVLLRIGNQGLFGGHVRGQRLAEAYIARNAQSPDLVASAVEEIIHRGTRAAPHRCVIGASPEMRFVVSYLPQWVLDAATRAQLVGKG